jgi:hypothetical protein
MAIPVADNGAETQGILPPRNNIVYENRRRAAGMRRIDYT